MASLEPEVVIIDSEDENSTLATEFLLEYTTTSTSVLSMDEPIGNIYLNVLLENGQVIDAKLATVTAYLPFNATLWQCQPY